MKNNDNHMLYMSPKKCITTDSDENAGPDIVIIVDLTLVTENDAIKQISSIVTLFEKGFNGLVIVLTSHDNPYVSHDAIRFIFKTVNYSRGNDIDFVNNADIVFIDKPNTNGIALDTTGISKLIYFNHDDDIDISEKPSTITMSETCSPSES